MLHYNHTIDKNSVVYISYYISIYIIIIPVLQHNRLFSANFLCKRKQNHKFRLLLIHELLSTTKVAR